MFQTPVIKNNIAITHYNVVEYWYEVYQRNITFYDKKSLQQASDTIKEMLSVVNLDGTIYVVPYQISKQKIMDNTTNLHQKYAISQAVTYDEYLQRLDEQLLDVYYAYKLFVVFLDNRKDISKKSKRKQIIHTDVAYKKIFNVSVAIEHNIYSKMTHHFAGTKRATIEEISYVRNHLYNPMIDVRQPFNHITYQPLDLSLQLTGVDTNGKKSIIHTSYGMLTLPKTYPPFKIFNQLQELDYPMTLIIKFSIIPATKVSKEVMAKKKQIIKDIEFDKREYGVANSEYLENKKLSTIAEQEFFIREKDKILVQVMVRTFAERENVAVGRLENIAENVKHCGIKMERMVTKQRQVMLHTFPHINYLTNHIQHLNIEAFSNLNLLYGHHFDDDTGTLFSLRSADNQPILLDKTKTLEHRAKINSTTGIVTGVTRSGKSFFIRNDIFRDINIFGCKTLLIDIKEKEMAEAIQKLPQEYKKMTKSIELLNMRSKGKLDPLLNETDIERAYENVLYTTQAFCRMLKIHLTDFHILKKALIQYMEKSQQVNKQTTYRHFLLLLANQTSNEPLKIMAESIKTLENVRMAHLFFADETTMTDTFDDDDIYLYFYDIGGLPDITNFDTENMEHLLANMVLKYVDKIVMQFMTSKKGIKKVIVEEYKTYKLTPSGKNTVLKINRMCATYSVWFYVISQNLSDFDSDDENGIFNNTSMFLIGATNDEKEADYIIKKLRIASEYKSVIFKDDKAELNKDKMYQFLFKDFDNNFSVVKQIPFMKEIGQAFNTKGVNNNYEE